MTVEILPATVERFDDLATLIGPSRPGQPVCWCLSQRLASSESSTLKTEPQRRARMRALTEQPVAPGLIAYVDGEPAGWVAVGPREGMGRLQRSRTIPPFDDVAVWSVICFVVRPGFRRQGLQRQLLHAAVAFAAEHDAPAIEGYPIDPQGRRLSAVLSFVGFSSVFDAEGFSRLAVTGARSAGLPRVLMRKTLR